jgi:hypothetical protein
VRTEILNKGNFLDLDMGSLGARREENGGRGRRVEGC